MFFSFINCLKFKQHLPVEKKLATITGAGLVLLFYSEIAVVERVEENSNLTSTVIFTSVIRNNVFDELHKSYFFKHKTTQNYHLSA